MYSVLAVLVPGTCMVEKGTKYKFWDLEDGRKRGLE